MKIVILGIFFVISMQALTLDQALRDLNNNNLDIKISQNESEIALLAKEQKKASQFGVFKFNSSMTKYNEKRTLAPLAPPISSDVTTSDRLTTVGVSYSVMLFNGFGLTNEIAIADLNNFITKEKEKLTLYQMQYNTQVLFSDILSLQNRQRSYEKYQAVLNSLKVIIEKEFEYGKKAKVDIYKIDSDIKKNQAIIIELQTKITILKNSLSLLIYGKIKHLEALEDIVLVDTEKQYDLKSLPQIKIAQTLQNKSNKNYNTALSTYYPTLSLESAYANTYGAGEKETVSSIALQLNWNIFDFGIREKNLQKAKIEKIKAHLEYEKLHNEYQNKLVEAKELIKQNKSLLSSAKSQLKLAQKTTQIEKIRYEQDQISINDYLLAFSNEQLLQANEIQAQINLLKSQFYFQYLTKE